MALLVVAPIGAEPPIGSEQIVDPLDRFVLVRADEQAHRDGGKGAIQIEGRPERAPRHPDDAVTPVVGNQRPGRQRVDELRAERDADDLELALAAVDDRAEKRDPRSKPCASAKAR
jgi:hypothetical protein